ncbi:hypothetical protein GFC29_3097 [Anoxybacillus sp. B7M1]|nr:MULTISPECIES: hypothetical protein [unclassified Anoxybacillus]ANB59104.1 hypothetical protein GFC28_2339 [Anoxybacillus sp. B2M1]ANB64472.1 hypothetical protein GFC29_3097 [Anoxybacillus sp. B7M1]
MLQEVDLLQKARRAQLTAIVQDMRRRGIKIDFVSQMIKKEKSSL